MPDSRIFIYACGVLTGVFAVCFFPTLYRWWWNHENPWLVYWTGRISETQDTDGTKKPRSV